MNKRPLETNGDSPSKKLKSASTPGSSTGAAPIGNDLIAQKQAEFKARLAAMQNKIAGANASAAPGALPSPGSQVSKATMGSSQISDIARTVAEAKAKKQAALARQSPPNPYVQPASSKKGSATPADVSPPQGAGLQMAAHPLLLDTSSPAPQSKKDRYKPMQPKFASIKANVRNTPTPTPPSAVPTPAPEIKANPYASQDAASGSFEGAAPKDRTSRSFKFNQKGKYVQIASQMRHDAALEALKQRIAESARKAGLDSEFETVEKNIRREAPPKVEWWDVALLPGESYDDLTSEMSTLNIRTADSPINMYVQHPIKIPAPSDKEKMGLKPLMLTKKEQKKMRKQRRQQELQDHRDRVKMGLIPPDAPKVRLANLMKVLTNDAIQDPTRVEARVRREVAMRKHNHEKMNAERKLTDEQRREKTETKKAEEEKKGLVGAVFKVKTLSDGSHRFKVRKNAEQLNLTGLVIFHPQFSMIYVEGATALMKKYKRLMLHRIHWTEASAAREEEVVAEDGVDENGEGTPGMSTPIPSSTKNAGGEQEESEYGTASLEGNRCDLIWEGQIRERVFKGLRPKKCPSDALAKEALGTKMAGFWDQTKNWKPEEVELF